MHHSFRFCVHSGLFLGLSLITPSIFAATIAVTTTDDVVSIDGQCSLREAVSAANLNMPFSDCPTGEALPVIDEIELSPGTYALTLEPTGEDMNAGGDLDILEAVTVRGLGDDFIWWDDPNTPDVETLDVFNDPEGFPRTFTEAELPDVVIENGIGKPSTPGDGDRVIHVVAPPPPPSLALLAPSSPGRGPAPAPAFTFENLAIARGDAWCTGVTCNPGAAGIFHEANVDLTLRRVALFDNRTRCSGLDCGSRLGGAALSMPTRGDLRIQESVIAANSAACADTDCGTSTIVYHEAGGPNAFLSEIDQTLMTANRGACSSRDCVVNDLFRFETNAQRWTQSVITRNEMACEAGGFECGVEEMMDFSEEDGDSCLDASCFHELADIEVSENQSTCSGFDCNVDEIIDIGSHFVLSTDRLRIRGNEFRCTGFSCSLNDLASLTVPRGVTGAASALRDLEITENVMGCEGTECEMRRVLFHRGTAAGTLSNVSVRGGAACVGDRCAAGPLVDLQDLPSITGLSVTDTTLSCAGVECRVNATLTVVVTDPLASNIENLVLTGNQSTCTGTPCGLGFSGNSINDGGGAVRIRSAGLMRAHVTLDDATITDNVTVRRGALGNNAILDIVDSTISGNTTTADGGAIWNSSFSAFNPPRPEDAGILNLVNTVVDSNMASGVGGAIVNPVDAIFTITGGSIAGNMATDGGGVWNEGTVTFVSGGPFANASMPNTPNNCVNAGAGTGCLDLVFLDGFEAGDVSAWSQTVP